MTPGIERMLEVAKSERAVALIDGSFSAITRGSSWQHAMSFMTDRLASMFGLSGEIAPTGVVLHSATSRAKHPACILISRQIGQNPSPSAIFYRSTAVALIQVFEGDADDRDVAGDCPLPTHRLETKGRVLLH